jgi:hypothetical protein
MASTSLVSSSVWTMVLSLPLMLASAGHCPPVLCGDVTISFPFGIVQEQATSTNCGAIGFQVRCVNATPFLGYSRYAHWFQILTVFYDNASLVVADSHKLEKLVGASNSNASVVDESCRIPKNNSSTKVALPFSISPVNQEMILYDCTKTPAPAAAAGEGLVETRCGNSTFARVGGRRYGESDDGRYFLDGCGATVVPVLAKYGEANASNYEELISDGFLLTWKTPGESKLHSWN